MEIAQATMLRGEVPDAFKSGGGYGYGDDGYGGGYGYGDGCGDDYSGGGYGYGGYGYGHGYGSGEGYGEGYGSKEYWLATIPYFASKMPEAQQQRLAALQKSGATIAFWRSDKSGCACNGGTSSPVSVGTVEKINGPLRICTRQALHATFIPPKWKGERWWIVALIGETQTNDDKVAALKREIIGECL